MKNIRLILKQNEASFKVEGTVDYRPTYPLPPFATVIGAIHTACGYTKYHDMDISVQGYYDTISTRLKTSRISCSGVPKDNRGILSYTPFGTSVLSNAVVPVAEIKLQMGSSFKSGEGIQIHNKGMYNKYLSVLDNKDARKSEYRTVIKGIYKQEVLNNCTWIIHIHTSNGTAQDILENISNLTSLGRSEDFIDLVDCREVELTEGYSTQDTNIYLKDRSLSQPHGATYTINKTYTSHNGKRTFDSKTVLYTTSWGIKSTVDEDGYLVSYN